MILEAIGFSDYRSIGDEPIWIDLTKKVAVIVGENNSGKSNVLRGVLAAKHRKPWNNIDHFRMDLTKEPKIHVKFRFVEADNVAGVFRDDCLEVKFKSNAAGGRVATNWGELDGLQNEPLRDFARKILKKPYDNFYPHEVNYEQARYDLKLHFGQQPDTWLSEVYFIPQFRKISDVPEYAVDGNGIIRLLGAWQRPKIGLHEEEKKFLSIEKLLRRLLNIDQLELRVDHELEGIQIKRGPLLLPLDSFGTGVHELIILSVAVQQIENAIVCIEEPEIHLHPRLQKVFLKYLLEETNNKYVISTHSNSLIHPSDEVGVIHVWAENGISHGKTVDTSRKTLQVLHDLGVKASDILQTNCVIWVEGPSDQIYINRWLYLANNELVEGIHYQIMFYGGHLRSHVSMEPVDPERVSEFIPLLLINQNSVFVMDSDKKAEDDKINESKERIKVECEKHELFCWTTEGREIENYLSATHVSKAYDKLTEQNVNLTLKKWEKIEKPIELKYGTKLLAKWKYGKNKPAMSRLITEEISDLSECQYDLKQQIEKLVEHILKANHNEI